MPKVPDTKARKEPAQRRARVTRDAIVEAAVRILATDGVPACTTVRIAAVAGVSVGSLYQYFPNREAILAAATERLLAEDHALALALLAPTTEPLRVALPALVRAIVAHQRRSAPLLAALLPELAAIDRATLARQTFDDLAEPMATWVGAHPHELRPELRSDPERLRTACRVWIHAVRGVLNALVQTDPRRLDDPAVTEEILALSAMLLA